MNRRKFIKLAGIGSVAGTSLLSIGCRPMTTINNNYYLQGNYAPVKNIVSETNLNVIGEIPNELSGVYMRNGPNPMGSPNNKKYHWFTGEGMLHGVRIDNGKALWYRNRIVGNPKSSSSQPNTHVIYNADKIYATVEAGGHPVEINKELESLPASPFQGTLNSAFSAHTKLDAETGELHAMCYEFPKGSYQVNHVIVGKDGKIKSTQAIDLNSKTMLHECAITNNYILILDLSVTFSLRKLATGYFPFSWNDKHSARIGILDRKQYSEEIKWFEINPCYFFHTVNAHEDERGNIVLDAMRYQRLFDTDPNGPLTESSPFLTRWTLNLENGSSFEEQLDDVSSEFPRIHPLLDGQFNRYSYALGLGPSSHPDFGRIMKYDLVKSSREIYEFEAGMQGAEPIFIPSQNAQSEDDGYLVAFVYDQSLDKSNLLIFNALEIMAGPVAQIALPQRVPFGFHGNWFPT